MKFIFIIILILISCINILAQTPYTISKEFNLFTSKNAQGYFKPLATTLSESFTSAYYTTANYKKAWTFAFDITIMELFIPASEKNYEAELPIGFNNRTLTNTAIKKEDNILLNIPETILQPTLYGGHSTPVFSSPLIDKSPDSLYRTVTFIEGNNIERIVGFPALQLIIGLPTRTQLRGRYFAFTTPEFNILSYGIGLNQNIDKFFDLFSEKAGLAVNFSYNSFNINPGLNMNFLSAGLHYSYSFDFGLNLYCGLQYEYSNGKFIGKRRIETSETEYLNSPYEEIRNGANLEFDVLTDNFGRVLGGMS